jgi:hypothetical protein
MVNAVLKVGDGRGFVVECDYLGRVVITAAHCVAHAKRADRTEGLPPCHLAREWYEETYPALLGPLGTEPTVWAVCLFADLIADIAVLGQPDNHELLDQADAYDQLVNDMEALAIADAPAQGVEVKTIGDDQFETRTPGKGPARVLSLDGHWLDGQVSRKHAMLVFEPEELIINGMSGSPILDASGAAIAVIACNLRNPVIIECLSAYLVRDILAASDGSGAIVRE